MPIEAMPLCQLKAPASYVVESPMGTEREVRWDGLRWSDEKISDEGHGDQEKTSDLPQAGSMPASSSDSGEYANIGKAAAAVHQSRAEGSNPSSSSLPIRRRGRRARRISRKEAMPHDHQRSWSSGEKAHGTLDGNVEPEVQSSGPAFAFGSLKKFAPPPGENPPTYDHLARPLRPLYIELDRTRLRFDKARDLADGDKMAELGPDYYAAIEAVDQADPGFYLGRHNPLPPLPRYIPPIDLAAISAGLGARLELDPEPVEETS